MYHYLDIINIRDGREKGKIIANKLFLQLPHNFAMGYERSNRPIVIKKKKAFINIREMMLSLVYSEYNPCTTWKGIYWIVNCVIL